MKSFVFGLFCFILALSSRHQLVCGDTEEPKQMTLSHSSATFVRAIQKRGVVCNAYSYCPSGNTCCALASDQWGCCPTPNAVCCADRMNCCPSGYTCGSGDCRR